MGCGKDRPDEESSDKGLFSNLAGFAAGHYPPHMAHTIHKVIHHLHILLQVDTHHLDILLRVDTHHLDILLQADTHHRDILLQADTHQRDILLQVDTHLHHILPWWIPYIWLSWSFRTTISFRAWIQHRSIAGWGAAAAAALYGAHQLSHGAHHLGHGCYYGHGFGHHGSSSMESAGSIECLESIRGFFKRWK
ncbi:hypothetical protein AAG906_039129 [Vitis piasezkii]